MESVHIEFTKFMTDLESRLGKIGIKLNEFPIDHICYRVTNSKDFTKYFDIFKNASRLYTKKHFHDRYFCMFALKLPLTYLNIDIPYIEFSEPGGSDTYDTGFQHIEYHSNKSVKDVNPEGSGYEHLLFSNKYGDEIYLKWPDKVCVKFTKQTIATKSLLEDNPEIFVRK